MADPLPSILLYGFGCYGLGLSTVLLFRVLFRGA